MPDAPLSVSAILLTFDCAPWVAEALESLLAQDSEPIEILVSDDASTDGTWETVQRIADAYSGPHRVQIRRRAENSGSKSAHLNDAFAHTTGGIIVSFDGDDVYETDRIARLLAEFRRGDEVMAVYSDYEVIDRNGRRTGPGRVPHPGPDDDAGEWFARVDAYASGSTLAVRRTVIEAFGPLEPDVHEDIVLPFRASLLGAVRFVDAPLVRARVHPESLTADDARFGSVEAYRRRLLRGIEKARRHREVRRDDLDRALRLDLLPAERIRGLHAVVDRSLEDAQLTAGLVAPGLLDRCRALRQVIRSGRYRDERAQQLALVLAPGLYLWLKRRRRGIGPAPAAD